MQRAAPYNYFECVACFSNAHVMDSVSQSRDARTPLRTSVTPPLPARRRRPAPPPCPARAAAAAPRSGGWQAPRAGSRRRGRAAAVGSAAPAAWATGCGSWLVEVVRQGRWCGKEGSVVSSLLATAARSCGQAVLGQPSLVPAHFITASARLAPWSSACWKGEAPYMMA